MVLFRHEWRQGRLSLAVWTGSIALLLAACLALFPEMKGEMAGLSETFASMGSFTAAFGMDRLSFGTLVGFYAIECGNVLGLGGAFFAALAGISALAKEEKERTAEFLLTHPLPRHRIVTAKLAAVLSQIAVLNAVVLAVALGTMAAIGEPIPWRELGLMHLAYFLMQVELACVCLGLSAFLRRGSLGIGLGLALTLYLLNLMANLTDRVAFLRRITPFAYCEGADIVNSGALDGGLLLLALAYAAVGLAAAYLWYDRKDIS